MFFSRILHASCCSMPGHHVAYFAGTRSWNIFNDLLARIQVTQLIRTHTRTPLSFLSICVHWMFSVALLSFVSSSCPGLSVVLPAAVSSSLLSLQSGCAGEITRTPPAGGVSFYRVVDPALLDGLFGGIPPLVVASPSAKGGLNWCSAEVPPAISLPQRASTSSTAQAGALTRDAFPSSSTSSDNWSIMDAILDHWASLGGEIRDTTTTQSCLVDVRPHGHSTTLLGNHDSQTMTADVPLSHRASPLPSSRSASPSSSSSEDIFPVIGVLRSRFLCCHRYCFSGSCASAVLLQTEVHFIPDAPRAQQRWGAAARAEQALPLRSQVRWSERGFCCSPRQLPGVIA